MGKWCSIFIGFILLTLIPLSGGTSDDPRRVPPVVKALKATEEIKVDGELSERVWKGPGVSRFVQHNPADGAVPTEKTEFWVAYDDKALYVAARLFDQEPSKIVARLSRRDEVKESDSITLSLDPYRDGRTGYQFTLSPAGSIYDGVLYNDSYSDETWDGVWEGKARVDGQGWTVEYRIPFGQLRFRPGVDAPWGINVKRVIQRKNEEDYLAWVPKEEKGFVSHFALLEGIGALPSPTHLDIVPYVVGQGTFQSQESGNPLDDSSRLYGNMGVDVKWGVKSNLTLDLTLNPDFGQVEVDPAELNLSAYETYYQEKRPFFIEGTGIFDFGRGGATSYTNINWSEPEFFYSRRIGRSPQGNAEGEWSKSPDRTTILGAAKVTGKVGDGWNVGVLNAITSRENADVILGNHRSERVVEPLTDYSLFRLQKDLKDGRYGVGFLGTAVIRQKEESLKGQLPDNSFALGFDGWSFLDQDRNWVFNGWFGASRVSGDPEAILRLKTASTHYFQRPDADHIELEPNSGSLSGWAGRFRLNKQKGNVLFNAAVGFISPGFDTNDVGYQSKSDLINLHVMSGYQWIQPNRYFRSGSLLAIYFRNSDFGGTKNQDGLYLSCDIEFLNYWEVQVSSFLSREGVSNTFTRGGPQAVTPASSSLDVNVESDNRKPVVFSVYSGYQWDDADGWDGNVGLEMEWKVKSNLTLSFEPSYQKGKIDAQWVGKVADPTMVATYGNRYLFASLDRQIVSGTVKMNWTFSPVLSLQLYLQPYIAVGGYEGFKELRQAKSYDFNVFGQNGSTLAEEGNSYRVDPDGAGPHSAFTFRNPDFNMKSLRGTVVLRWEYRPGSSLYFVWTQDRADYSNPGQMRLGRDLGDLFTAEGSNIFLVKATYRWGA